MTSDGEASLDECERIELEDEYEDERECLVEDGESEESAALSRPRDAMSSTKEGKVVVMAGDRSQGRSWRAISHGQILI